MNKTSPLNEQLCQGQTSSLSIQQYYLLDTGHLRVVIAPIHYLHTVWKASVGLCLVPMIDVNETVPPEHTGNWKKVGAHYSCCRTSRADARLAEGHYEWCTIARHVLFLPEHHDIITGVEEIRNGGRNCLLFNDVCSFIYACTWKCTTTTFLASRVCVGKQHIHLMAGKWKLYKISTVCTKSLR